MPASDGPSFNPDDPRIGTSERSAREREILTAALALPFGGVAWQVKIAAEAALVAEQAGATDRAAEYLAAVEAMIQGEGGQRDKQVAAYVDNRRGWLLAELKGDFDEADRRFASSLRLASEVGLPDVEGSAHHFLIRNATERAMSESGAWFRATPARPLRSTTARRLREAVERHQAPTFAGEGRENPHTHIRSAIAQWLLGGPDLTPKQRRDLETLSRTRGEPGPLALMEAKRYAARGEWDRAVQQSAAALEAYSDIAYPPGMALSAAMEAVAVRAASGASDAAVRAQILDLLCLALLLHPYPSHPVWSAVRAELQETVRDFAGDHQTELDEYIRGLDERVALRQGQFRMADRWLPQLPRAHPLVGALTFPDMTTALLAEMMRSAFQPGTRSPFPESGREAWALLSPRQREVVDLLVNEGLTRDQIAARLVVSTAAVDAHLDRIRIKLGLEHRREIVPRLLNDRP